MVITLGNLIIWLIIAALVGFIGELISQETYTLWYSRSDHFRVYSHIPGCGCLHWHIIGEPYLNGVPLITSILAAAVIVAIWSAFAYRHAYGYYSRYYRRGGYVRRPRRRYRWF